MQKFFFSVVPPQMTKAELQRVAEDHVRAYKRIGAFSGVLVTKFMLFISLTVCAVLPVAPNDWLICHCSDCRVLCSSVCNVNVTLNADSVWWCQVYDRLGPNDLTVEYLLRELGATFSAAAAEQVFSSSAEYDSLRLVISTA